jgi:hypothetical protein
MMDRRAFENSLSALGLTLAEAAEYLSVDQRTIRRWLEANEIPGAPREALKAWCRLEQRGISWRPDVIAIGDDDPETIAEQIAALRQHALELDAVLKKVEARGGPAAPWQVDTDKCRATLGPMEVSYYRLRNGGFSPSAYRRRDHLSADLRRDQALLEDAYASIAYALSSKKQKSKK